MRPIALTLVFLFAVAPAFGQERPPAGDTLRVRTEEPPGEDLEEVTISTTRSSRTISDLPTRVEVIAGEELDEKSNRKPGDIRMLLSESTGILTQQTSATSANAAIRIQGLDGRYTQLLKDGFPLYAGAAAGLGLLQTPPLDLKQVEVIKGSSSTLYGGGAIAGLVNLISKTPGPARELRFHLNGSGAGALDLSGFYGQRFGKAGITLFAARNSHAPYDPAGTGFTAIPKYTRYTLNPHLFLYPGSRTKIRFGINTTVEDRTGGDLYYVRGSGDSLHSYFERNESQRFSTQLSVSHQVDGGRLQLKNSYSYFNRDITIPDYAFSGVQQNTFTELSYSQKDGSMEWVMGANLITEVFREKEQPAFPLRNYSLTTSGLFIQNTAQIGPRWAVESGLRGDFVIGYGLVGLPRLSVLYKAPRHFSSRLGGGLGYKPPTIFTEESERVQYRNVYPIASPYHQPERSYGAGWDLNYRTRLWKERVSLSINHLFFYTRIRDPLQLVPIAGGEYFFQHTTGHMLASGTETNIKAGYRDWKLLLGYTYTRATIHEGAQRQDKLLTPRHRLNTVLMYEAEERWKVGLEAHYSSSQLLSDGRTGRGYWVCGLMAERLWERFSLYLNFENFLDARQSRWDTIYTGPVSRPRFRDIYAPLDGFVVNGGLKFKL